MKSFLSYCRTHLLYLLLPVLVAVLFAAFLLMAHLPVEAMLYPAAVSLFLTVCFITVDYRKYRSRQKQLQELLHTGTMMAENLPTAALPMEEEYQALIEDLAQYTAGLQTSDAATYQDMVDYFTVWAHQIKTPIAAMKLNLQNEDSILGRKLRSDLFRIEQYVDMVMAFLRLDSDFSDYVFRTCELDGIIRSSVRKFALEFIGRKISLEYTPVSLQIVTDEKWLQFVLEQLLSNALKYTRAGSVRIYLSDENTLCVEDTGIGIAPGDLPRIFEKGYTGQNGRVDKSASGLGLYLCSSICKKLGISISASSCPGVGTAIRLRFSQDDGMKE